MPAQRVTFSLERTSEGGRGTILPDGVYKLRVEEVEVKQGQAGPYVAMKLKVVQGGKATLYSNLSSSDKSRWVVEQFLDAAGFPKKGAPIGPEKFRGKEVWAEVGNSSYESKDKKMKMKNEVKNWLTAEDAAQLADVYAQNKSQSKPEQGEEATDPFQNSYTGDGEDEDDDEAVFSGMPSFDGEDDEFKS